MNRLINTTDLSIHDLFECRYDLVILGCGYEERSIYFASRYLEENQIQYNRILTLKFGYNAALGHRVDNETYLFNTFDSMDSLELTKDSTNKITSYLLKWVDNLSELNGEFQRIRILVDYSVMTRDWFSTVISFCMEGRPNFEFSIDFVYSYGRHTSENRPSIISKYICLNGCEGRASRVGKTIAIIGLGFESEPPIALVEQLEPDRVFAFIADPGVISGYESLALRLNANFVDEYIGDDNDVIRLPVSSVTTAYRNLYDLTSPFLRDHSITISSFGPKPLVLASILLALNTKEVSFLYARLERFLQKNMMSVPAVGGMVISRLDF